MHIHNKIVEPQKHRVFFKKKKKNTWLSYWFWLAVSTSWAYKFLFGLVPFQLDMAKRCGSGRVCRSNGSRVKTCHF